MSSNPASLASVPTKANGCHFRCLKLALALSFAAAACPQPADGSVAAPIGSFVQISDSDGLADSDVRAITQDQDGFIWFGLRLGGLSRYDGYELKSHTHDPANPRTIGHQVIWSLLVDRSGVLWVGTEGGLDRYDRATGSFTHFRHEPARPDSLPNDVVVCLFEDAAGHLWAGTRDGVCRMDDRTAGRFTTFRRPPVLEGSTSKDTFRSITEDPSTGLLWLGGTDGLAAFDPRTGCFASYRNDPNDPLSVSRTAVNKVLLDKHGSFWALTEAGLNSFVPALDRIAAHAVQTPRIVFKRFLQPESAVSPGANFVRDGVIDHQDRLWLATRGGLQLFDQETGKFISYQRHAADPSSLSDDLTQTVFEDRSGNIWVGTYAGGANRLRSEAKPFVVHRHRPGDPASISDDRIVGLAFDASGKLWAGTVNGLNRFDGHGWKRFLHEADNPGSLPSNDLATIAASPTGEIWAGTNYGGLYRYADDRFVSIPTVDAAGPAPSGWRNAAGAQVNSILPDEIGGVWLGTRVDGLDYLRDGRVLHYNPQDGDDRQPSQPTSNPLLGVIRGDGTMWFATETNGLVRLDRGTQRFTAFLPRNGTAASSHNFHCISEGGDTTIWIGAAEGLFKFDLRTEQFTRHYSTQHGLPHAAIMTIVRDRRGHLWLGTARGLADFDPEKETFRVYEKPDGLPSNVFAQRAGTLGPDGRVYLGTRSGVVVFSPEELQDNPIPPTVVVTEFRWLGTPPVTQTGSAGSVDDFTKTIHVVPGQAGFSLKFAALDYTVPEKNRYRYRLEGWDRTWSSADARVRTATYTALPPGDYNFRVQASNADNVWNEQGASVHIVVEPYFWQTLWFRAGGALIGIVLIGTALHWRLRAVRRHNVELEQQVSQRTAQLQEEVCIRQGAEAALRESHAELERRVQIRTAELARTNESLEAEIAGRKTIEAQLRQAQKMEAVGQLAGGIAHDFNNLLTVILGQSALLSDPGLPAYERDAAVRDIKAAAQRATNLTRQLLVFSRHQSMNPVAVDLNRVIGDVSKLLRHVISENIALQTALTTRPLGVLADPGMLEQVLMNLAVNARDAMPHGGQLTLSTTPIAVTPEQTRARLHAQPGEYARFSVTDTGVGIAPEILSQIFEPFFTTKEAGKGTGLGLAISLGIVQQHRGWIDVESAPGHGSTFHVFLPCHPLPQDSEAAKPAAPTHSRGDTTILVAEDEAAVRGLVKHILMRQGYRVIEAVSGADALTCWSVHKEEITVLLTDIVMPGWPNGHELAARLREERPALRVVTMSGYDPGEFGLAARRSNLDAPHVRKPFSADDLLRAIESTRKD